MWSNTFMTKTTNRCRWTADEQRRLWTEQDLQEWAEQYSADEARAELPRVIATGDRVDVANWTRLIERLS